MRLLLWLMALLPLAVSAQEAKIIRVIDGDTVVIAAPWVPDPLKKEISVRVLGIDTPEKHGRAQCDSEATQGEQATLFTQQAVAKSKRYEVALKEWDKFGGRILGDVILDGVSLRSLLIQNHLARDYHGEKKQSWCGVE